MYTQPLAQSLERRRAHTAAPRSFVRDLQPYPSAPFVDSTHFIQDLQVFVLRLALPRQHGQVRPQGLRVVIGGQLATVTHDLERVSHRCGLDLLVDGRFEVHRSHLRVGCASASRCVTLDFYIVSDGERRVRVHFEEVKFKVFVEHHVEPHYLEAVERVGRVGLCVLVLVLLTTTATTTATAGALRRKVLAVGKGESRLVRDEGLRNYIREPVPKVFLGHQTLLL
mmetsp:Transcript_6375/g.10978  ORF Transcript_6375/g.10978 Transcript_6375/m.10978 type:complete len:225 (+) Transcript_6375:224-898(+)